MSILRFGAYLDRPPGPRYLAALHFAELGFSTTKPKPSTLARFRSGLPEPFRISLVLPNSVWQSKKGPLRNDETLEEGLRWARAAIDELQPAFVVLPTGAHITPGSRDRSLLRSYFDALGDGATRVWEPGGLWQMEDADDLAADMGVVCAFDPLMEEAPSGNICYARLNAVGGRRHFVEGALIDALEAVLHSGADEIYVAIRSPGSFREAVRMQELASELA